MKDEKYVVVIDGKDIRKTEDLVKVIVDMGHKVSVAVTSHVTTFGMALCLEEEDGTFTQVPLAAMVENGYTDRNDRKSYTALTHGGLNLDIKSGPLLNNINIQHFIAIEVRVSCTSTNCFGLDW